MLNKNYEKVLALMLVLPCLGVADTINGSVNMDFVTIDAPGGSVSYNYRIGRKEVSREQFSASGIVPKAPTTWTGFTNAPAVSMTFHEAAQYCNWLTTGDVNSGAYGMVSNKVVSIMDRASLEAEYLSSGNQQYVLPTEEEWMKAAYYNGTEITDYANGTSTIPTNGTDAIYLRNQGDGAWDVDSGSTEQNGTLNMSGNVWEWLETTKNGDAYNPAFDGQLMSMHGGDYFRNARLSDAGVDYLISSTEDQILRSHTWDNTGMRIVAIPEPGTISLMSMSTLGLFLARTIRRRKQLGKSLIPIRRAHLCDTYCTSLDELNRQDESAEFENTLFSRMTENIKAQMAELFSMIRGTYKNVDQVFWNRMVVVHETHVAKRQEFRKELKSKAMARLDTFLALIMK